jgi:hypothetical protein
MKSEIVSPLMWCFGRWSSYCGVVYKRVGCIQGLFLPLLYSSPGRSQYELRELREQGEFAETSKTGRKIPWGSSASSRADSSAIALNLLHMHNFYCFIKPNKLRYDYTLMYTVIFKLCSYTLLSRKQQLTSIEILQTEVQ